MIERLKQAEASKISFLIQDSDELQQDIVKIEDMLKNIEELTTIPMDPQEFLLRTRQVDQWIDFTLAKPLKAVPDINPYDLPQELKSLREKLNQSAAYQELLEFKDQVIHKLLREKESQENRIREMYEKKFQEELYEWSKITDQFGMELNNLKLVCVCYYDGAPLDKATLNQPCLANSSEEVEHGGHSEDVPDPAVNGTLRHFWGRPKKTESPIKRSQQTLTENIKQYQVFLDIVIPKIKKELARTNTNLQKLFVTHDKNNSGEISPFYFHYILQVYCNLEENESEKIAELINPEKREAIEYARFLDLLNLVVN